MADTLYSLAGGLPAPLPAVLTAADGYPRTGQARHAAAVDLGYVPVPPAPPHDPTAQHPPAWTGAGWAIADKTAAEIEAQATAARTAGWAVVREKRTSLLTLCDWTQLADAPLGPQELAAWAVYRTALRDLPATYGAPDGDPSTVVWPLPPTT